MNNESMVGEVMLTEKTKEELIEIILEERKKRVELENKVRELEQRKRVEKFAKPNTAKKRKKRPGQKVGHVGITRRVPEHIDEVIEETLEECPECHHALGKPIEGEEEVQEDIIPARVHVRKYRRHVYCCEHCRKEVKAAYHFMAEGYPKENLKRLSKRFAQSWLDIFRFLKDPMLAWNNNLAERMIRPNVIYRNRSFGNRSDRGAEAHGTLMSLRQTLRLQGKNVGENPRLAFLQHRQGHVAPCLSLGTR